MEDGHKSGQVFDDHQHQMWSVQESDALDPLDPHLLCLRNVLWGSRHLCDVVGLAESTSDIMVYRAGVAYSFVA